MIRFTTRNRQAWAMFAGVSCAAAVMAGEPEPCPSDINTDMVVDSADLGLLLFQYGDTGMGLSADLDEDDDVDQSDLGILGPRFGLFGNVCDNPFPPGAMSYSAERIDNSSVQPGDDKIGPDFAGGVTHFTFAINVAMSGGSVWTTSSVQFLVEPAAPYDIFQSIFVGDETDSTGAFIFPTVNYDTAVQAPQDMGLGDVGFTSSSTVSTADEFSIDCWFSVYPVPTTPADGMIARLSIVNTDGPGGNPIIVPAGTCPGAVRIGSVEIASTHAFTEGQLHTASYEIIENPLAGDLNGDLVVDTADLGLLISDFGGDAPYSDVNNDGVVDTADLGLVVGEFGQSCP